MEDSILKYNILCVEDNIGDIKQKLLILQKRFNAQIYVSDSCSQAKELISKMAFHLFILDIEMKGERFTGIQLAEIIRSYQSYSCTPILFISIHTHFSYRMLSRFNNCAFLKKPFTEDDLLLQSGVLLNIPEYVKSYYQTPILEIPISKQTSVSVPTKNISYIEIRNKEMKIQYIDGHMECFHCLSGTFKKLIKQIEEYPNSHLRQIHRAIVVNIDQIRCVETYNNIGSVWLFYDNEPKALGIRYRNNIKE